jgi:hypothetical protein
MQRIFALAIALAIFQLNQCHGSVSASLLVHLGVPGHQVNPAFFIDGPPPLGGASLADSTSALVQGNQFYTASGSVFLDVFPFLQMGAVASASGEFNDPFSPFQSRADATSRVVFHDVVFLDGANLPNELTFHFELEGETSSTGFAGAGILLNSGGLGISEPGFIAPVFNVIGGAVHYSLDLQAIAAATSGFATADAGHTVRLTAITLPNGNTPESEGISLRFESGATSPNLATVPEPSTFVVWTLLGLTFARGAGRLRNTNWPFADVRS